MVCFGAYYSHLDGARTHFVHGSELKARSVALTELTQIFEDVRESVYVDDCCHLNQTGYDIIALRMYDDLARLTP